MRPIRARRPGTLLRVLLSAVLLCASPAFADALDDAKRAGQVGEQSDGYLGVVSGGAGVQALVADVNARRRARYESIAERNGIELEAVELLAAQKAQEKTPAGFMIRLPDGRWVRK